MYNLLACMCGPSCLGPTTGYEGLWITLVISSCVAFCMNLCNLLVTFYTSAVTLSVLGNVKSVLVIVVSLSIFRNRISGLTIAGTVITLCSAGFYSQEKIRQSHQHQLRMHHPTLHIVKE
eukprot:m.81022 g.81022  ORF g.81022 m.81022 type:complete len:120 (-) comp9384_c0_seq2:300-659(-)